MAGWLSGGRSWSHRMSLPVIHSPATETYFGATSHRCRTFLNPASVMVSAKNFNFHEVKKRIGFSFELFLLHSTPRLSPHCQQSFTLL